MRKINILCLLLLLVFFIYDYSYSWFISGSYSQFNQFTIDIESLEDIKISSDGYNFSSSINFYDNTKLRCITSGGINFYYPEFSPQLVNNRYIYELNNLYYINDDVKDEYYFSKDFFIETSIESDIKFDFSNFNIDTANIVNSNGISCDALTGALRISIFQYDEDDDRWYKRIVIFPNSKYQLNNNTFNYNGNMENKYVFYNSNSLDNYYYIYTNNNGYQYYNGTYYVFDYSNMNDFSFASMNGTLNKFKLVIWLEGTDRECNNYLMNDTINDLFLNVSISLKFDY